MQSDQNKDQLDAERQIKSLIQQGQFAKVVSQLPDLLKAFPKSVQLHYMSAVANRYQEHYKAAESSCQRLIELAPTYGRAYQELGHLLKRLGRKAEALDAFVKAIGFNSALVASWRSIIELSVNSKTELVSRAKNALSHLESMPIKLQAVNSLINEGDIQKAELICRNFLKQDPRHPEAMRLLAMLGVKQSIIDEAEFILESCLEFHPDFQLARVDYINVLHKRQKYAQAYSEAKDLLSSSSHNPAFQMLYAEQCVALNKIDEALEYYRKSSKVLADNEVLWLMMGHAYKTAGDFESSVQSYQRAYQTRPDFGDAYWSLANLKTYKFRDAEIGKMEQFVDAKSTPIIDKYHLMFALGKAFEDKENYDSSSKFYQQGNQLKRTISHYTVEKNREKVVRQIQAFERPDFSQQKLVSSDRTVTPIFIVGLPRSGSTLIEQILSSHSQVEGTLELANIITMAHQLSRKKSNDDGNVIGYPAIVNALTSEELTQLGNRYLDETKIHRTNMPYFIDKMPNNFLHVGLILSILPHAKIIDARREPMACCFSGYKQLFAEGQEFSYGLDLIGDYYGQYLKLMSHWQRVYPTKILRVQYESVVSDIQGQVARILDFLELEYEDGCLEYYKNKRAVRTASAEQVRQPIYQKAVSHWKSYQDFLAPLKENISGFNYLD